MSICFNQKQVPNGSQIKSNCHDIRSCFTYFSCHLKVDFSNNEDQTIKAGDFITVTMAMLPSSYNLPLQIDVRWWSYTVILAAVLVQIWRCSRRTQSLSERGCMILHRARSLLALSPLLWTTDSPARPSWNGSILASVADDG